MINIVLLIIVLIILMISVFKYEQFQELIPLEYLISYEEVVCKGNRGEKGASGNPGYQEPTTTRAPKTPIIYVGSSDTHLYAIDHTVTDIQNTYYPLKWKFQTGGDVYSSPAIGADGVIYVGSMDKYLYAIYPNKVLKWKYLTGGYVFSSPVIGADGVIYVGSMDKHLHAINHDGSFKWKYDLKGWVSSLPALSVI